MEKINHTKEAIRAKAIYQSLFNSTQSKSDWHEAVNSAKNVVRKALIASNNLSDIEASLLKSGQHMLAYRHMMAPPISQDQFKLLEPSWPKSTERSKAPIKANIAPRISSTVNEWIDSDIANWLKTGHIPSTLQTTHFVETIAVLIAHGRFATDRRTLISTTQENDLLNILLKRGWTRIESTLVEEQSTLHAKQFMHKTKFATKTRPQEVDVACGLGKSNILAIECKVTNDETNSVKRINDVLKKAEAWKDHWGNFVKTAAMLQGVIKPADVQRLLAANVEVFWSHDLKHFEQWLDQYL